MFCLLGSGFSYFWPQIRILREISSLEPAPKVKIPEFRSENDEIYFLMCFFLNLFMGLYRLTDWLKRIDVTNFKTD